ncbi:UV-damaged DNA binding protein1 [Tieghemostelium lacteum]|uniref:DNA damage-binding protein 1 n=1 Tax=Tieghemostelium lacteum TaxID=361077 RepID=A0A152A3F6_TIELA|nr:UV-damaged DNA binding protein1 [Tieghemostelium lacteum]|eukprot:KYR00793.1 UV-damaged DNA binding protein1 [Tieghemostelium lacteum]
MYNFISTVQKPTAVSHSVTGRFTGPHDNNLIISKCTKIEIYKMGTDGLKPMLDVNIYGQISSLKLFSVNGYDQDLLFLSTERYRYCVLAYDQQRKEIITKLSGISEESTGRPSEPGQICIIDPQSKMIALHIYEGLLKVIPLSTNIFNSSSVSGSGNITTQEAFNLRLEELQIIDLVFLDKCDRPTLAVLYKDTRHSRHISTYEIKIDKDHSPGPWSHNNVEIGSNLLIAPPFGGVLVVGEQVITYLNGKFPVSVQIPFTTISCYEMVDKDGSRYLLGDQSGQLYLLLIKLDNQGNVIEMHIELLGETSTASSISYLDNGVVYIGSSQGDSQVIKLKTEKDTQTDSYLEILDTFENIGPIQDFCVVDLEKQGQGQIITCSGIFKDGTLRIVRNGIGIAEQASIELQGIKGIWSLYDFNQVGSSSHQNADRYLVVSFLTSTKILQFDGEEIEEKEYIGFDLSNQTIYCGNIGDHVVIQITRNGVYLIDGKAQQLLDQWKPSTASGQINLTSRNSNQILLASGNQLFYLEIQQKKIKQISTVEMPFEISCLDLSSFEGQEQSQLCAVGLWTDISVRLLRLPQLEEVCKEILGGEIIPRSVVLLTMEQQHYLFCSLGDGHLFNFSLNINNHTLHDRKKLTLGTQPIILQKFQKNQSMNIFASSDRPTVIYSKSKRIFYSIVNLKEVSHVCSFSSKVFPNCLAIANQSSLTIGTIDQIQKLHIKTVPLNGEMARRITYSEESSVYAIATLRYSLDDQSSSSTTTTTTTSSNNNNNNNNTQKKTNSTGYGIPEFQLKLLNDQTFEQTSSYQFQPDEYVWALTTCKFSSDHNTYIVVGTSYREKESGPLKSSQGRIIVFSVHESRLVLCEEQPTVEPVYYLLPYQGKLLAAVGKRIQVGSWKFNSQEENGKLQLSESVYKGHTMIVQLAARGDFILVGDAMKSMSLLSVTADGKFNVIGRNPQPIWLKSIAIIDDDHFLGAETSNNFVVIKKNSESTNEQERQLLDSVGHFHVGEGTNWLKHGSLVTLPEQDQQQRKIPTILYVTINGSIGVIASITKEEFDFFSKLQEGLNKVIKGIGGFSHSDWRSFANDHHIMPANNFIDGDLIEMYLDLDHDKMLKAIQGMNMSTDEVYKKIDTLMQHIR